jgi:hypothetical protein
VAATTASPHGGLALVPSRHLHQLLLPLRIQRQPHHQPVASPIAPSPTSRTATSRLIANPASIISSSSSAAPTRSKSSDRLQLATGSGLEATRGGTKHSMASARTARGEMLLIPRVSDLLLGYAPYTMRAPRAVGERDQRRSGKTKRGVEGCTGEARSRGVHKRARSAAIILNLYSASTLSLSLLLSLLSNIYM